MIYLNALAALLAGFSLVSAVSLALTHFSGDHYRGQPLSKSMGLLLLLALGTLQLAHFTWFYPGWPWLDALPYRLALFTVAPAFYLFSQPLLQPARTPASRARLFAHALPVVVGPWLPVNLALPLAFAIGAGYLLWLAQSLYALRRERARFHLEMLLLGAAFAIAALISLVGLFQTTLDNALFISLYAIATGLAFFLVHTVLGLRPQLAVEVSETAEAAYAHSTLSHVDCPAVLAGLDALMRDERIYLDPDLSLPGLAKRLGLTPHQLSELINARLGKSFSRYLRELRVAAAKAMLCAEPSASVLSVGLNAGFTSQSNFYEAFREIEGMTPGQYRKLRGQQV